MSDSIIEISNLGKRYSLGTIGTGTLYGDINRFWAKVSGKPDPYAIIGGEQKKENKEFWALSNITFNVKAGEILGIIGKNGAGKSTLLKILSKTTSPTTGLVKAYGRISSLLEVGTGFHPELTGRENIFLNGSILGMKKFEIKNRFDEIVDFAGVEKFIDTPVKRYSSGMYVRLAFAVAAHLEPDILIVDEVLAVGDAEFQRKCINKMNSVSSNEGRTVLFVSHNLAQINQICNKGVLLESGKLIFEGSIDQTISKYIGFDGYSNQIDTKNLLRLGVKSNEFEIQRLKMITNTFGRIYENESITFEITFKIRSYIKELVIGFVVRDNLDNHLLEPRSTISFTNLNLDTGDYVASVNFIINLKPGVYTLGLGARHLKGNLEYIPTVTQLEILPNNVTGEEWNKHNDGIFNIDTKWTINQL